MKITIFTALALFAFTACLEPRAAESCRVGYNGDEEIKRVYERNCGYNNSPQNQTKATKCLEWQIYIEEHTQMLCE